MRKVMISAVVVAAAGVIAMAAMSQTPQPAQPLQNQVKRYISSPLEGDATREVRLQSVTIPPGGANQFHRHPGDQWATVQEGEVVYTAKGEEPRILKVGDAVYIPRGTIHRNQNVSDKPARTVELVIVDKDKPQTEVVQ
jgi:quercetin dioxygenase-like cupin family protein